MPRFLIYLCLVCTPCLLSAQEDNSNDKLVAVSLAILESNGDLELKDGANLSAAGLNELIANLRKQNTLEHYQFFNLASLENQEAMIQFGQQEPVVTGNGTTVPGGTAYSHFNDHMASWGIVAIASPTILTASRLLPPTR